MFEFCSLPYQASTIGEGVFHSRESEQGVGSLTPPYATPVRNTNTGHPPKVSASLSSKGENVL